MRRKAGKDRAGTQGWRRSRQVAMPGEASGDARLPSAGSDLKASQARPGQSLLRKGQSRLRRGQFRLRRAKEPLKAGRWVEHGPAGKIKEPLVGANGCSPATASG